MKIGISQPTYLPWQGYFGLIDYVDEFVFLENVQFEKRSWQQRNKIRNKSEEIFLSVSVKTKKKYYQKILDVNLDNFKKTQKKHLSTIKNSYSNSKFFSLYYSGFEEVFNHNYEKLTDLNKSIILHTCKILEIKTIISSDNDLSFDSKNTDYIKDICLKKNCNNYVSTIGSKNYLGDAQYFPNTNIKINYFDFKNMEYEQNYNKFISKLSIIDLLFNLGPKSLNYIRKNFYICN